MRSSRGAPESLDTARPPNHLRFGYQPFHVLIGINSYAGRLHAVTLSTDGLLRAVQSNAPTDEHRDAHNQTCSPTPGPTDGGR